MTTPETSNERSRKATCSVWHRHVGYRKYDAGFTIGVQTFSIAEEVTLKSARWFERQLRHALEQAGVKIAPDAASPDAASAASRKKAKR